MPSDRYCSECGSPIPGNTPEGCCPRCLLGLADTAPAGVTAQACSDGLSLPAEPGQFFGNYELLDQIGQGGMGVVYKARQKGLDRTVAVKLLRSTFLAGEAGVKRFRVEAQAVARLQHPNVVSIHEVGEQNGLLFFSMDYVEGQNLAQVVRGTPLSADRAARYVKTIAEAIHYAHQRGILHRDLKPANILLDTSDQPRITDFGLAKQTEADSDLTVSGAVVGTPSYMPPEQAAGLRKEIGPASDVYSLGAVLYELVTGRPPFRADTPLDTLRQVVDNEPAPPRLLNTKVPRDLETICLKCLAKEPTRRYHTAQALAEDLGRLLKHEPIRARPVGGLGRLARWARRAPLVAGLTGVTISLLVMMTAAAMLSRFDTIEHNIHAAQLAARVLQFELSKLKSTVDEVGTNPQLLQLVLAHNREGLIDYLKRIHEAYTTNGTKAASFATWLVMTPEGQVLARWPPETRLQNRSRRDYFSGALQAARDGINPVYISRVYRSEDDTLHKFGMSKVIVDANHNRLGVLTGMVGTASTEGPLGLATARLKTVVIGLGDTNAPTGSASDTNVMPRFVIIWHPAFRAPEPTIEINHPLLRELAEDAGGSTTPRHDSWYRDRAAERYPQYAGLWLAGFARVPGMPFIVIYQSRDRVTDAVGSAAVVVIVGAAVVFGWRLHRRSRHSQTQPARIE